MTIFKITQFRKGNNFAITDGLRNYLHSDGSIYHKAGEYWPTRKDAQAILDKYFPKHIIVIDGKSIEISHESFMSLQQQLGN